ncbi:MAG TPA: transglutaminase family protein [Chitinophagales bacterium]|nr:transglutaminase family protein [Chitinophagales bacterium]HNI55041.1 transglutaminase family protein [Chitinophagales bacterium]
MEHREAEIQALIALLDDSDPEVFDHVAARLLSYGPMVIDKLEDAYTTIPNPVMQERIEDIIHQIQFAGVLADMRNWAAHGHNDLMRGLLIITRHQYPDLDEDAILANVARIQKDIWIGINTYLSPLEQMNVINQSLFSQYQFAGLQNNDDELRYAYINNMLDAFKGNHFSVGLLYLILCQQLDMPVYGVLLSTHFILARMKEDIVNFEGDNKDDILFYINPYNKGLAFSEREIKGYLSKLEIPSDEKYFKPASNKAVLAEYIRHLISLIKKPQDQYKIEDLEALLACLESE